MSHRTLNEMREEEFGGDSKNTKIGEVKFIVTFPLVKLIWVTSLVIAHSLHELQSVYMRRKPNSPTQ